MSFRAVDERGRAVGSSRDLADLQEQLAGRARASVSRSLTERTRPSDRPRAPARPGAAAVATPAVAFAEQTGVTDWTFGDLPAVVDTKVAGGVVRGYPAIVDETTSVALRIETTPEAAARATRAGVRRLALLAVPSPAAYVLEHLTSAEKLALAASPYPSAKALIEDARVAVADAVIARTAPDGVQTRAAFEAVRDAFSAAVVDERLPDRLARGAHPDGVARGRAGAARPELADPPRRPERREDAARGTRLPGIRGAHGLACGSRSSPATCAARSSASGAWPTTPAGTVSG